MDPLGALGYGEIQRTCMYSHAKVFYEVRIPCVLPKRSREKFTEKSEREGTLKRHEVVDHLERHYLERPQLEVLPLSTVIHDPLLLFSCRCQQLLLVSLLGLLSL